MYDVGSREEGWYLDGFGLCYVNGSRVSVIVDREVWKLGNGLGKRVFKDVLKVTRNVVWSEGENWRVDFRSVF